MKQKAIILWIFSLFLNRHLFSQDVLEFDLVKMPTLDRQKPLVLILSGIQGDEPGGFNATNLFLQHYKILSGEVWVIPNLNKHSILRNHRGIYGDLNRKFSTLNPSDPEYPLIQKIKATLLEEKIDVIYHLHDGGGFYRPSYIDAMRGPNRWGNCSIIDAKEAQGAYHQDLFSLSNAVIDKINHNLLADLHRYHIKNTNTAMGDAEMAKSLTFFALQNHKTALANEASKNLPLNERVYYHLLGIEGLLHKVGIKFERDFELDPKKIAKLLYPQGATMHIAGIPLPMFGLRSKLSYFPLPNLPLHKIPLQSDQYILGLLEKEGEIQVKYGNKVLTTLKPFQIEFAEDLHEVEIQIDGKRERVPMGSTLEVAKAFRVFLEDPKYRLNVIGYTSRDGKEEGKRITRKDCLRQYSLDKEGKLYRIEFYARKSHFAQEKFLGLILVKFQE